MQSCWLEFWFLGQDNIQVYPITSFFLPLLRKLTMLSLILFFVVFFLFVSSCDEGESFRFYFMNFYSTSFELKNILQSQVWVQSSARASGEKKMNAAIDSHVCNIKIRCFFEVRVSQFMNIKKRKKNSQRLLINNFNSSAHNQTSPNVSCLFLNDKVTIT